MRLPALVFLAATLALPQQPALVVFNAAGSSPQAPRTSLAPGAIVRIQIVPLAGGVIPEQPPSVTASIRSQGVPEAEPVAIRSAGPIDYVAVLPSDLPVGPAVLTVKPEGQPELTAAVDIVPHSVGIFTQNEDGFGFGPAAAQVYGPSGPEPNRLTRPATPGDFVTLWGTGLGTVAAGDVSVSIGGVPADVVFAGPAPGQPGLDQINLRVPATAPEGCYVSLIVRVAGVESNETSLSISRTAHCAHPFDLSGADLKTLDDGGSLWLSDVGIYQSVAPPPLDPQAPGVVRIESVQVGFRQRDALEVARMARIQHSPDYGCRLNYGGVYAAFVRVNGETDAGDSLELVSAGHRVNVLRQAFGGFYASDIEQTDVAPGAELLPPPVVGPGDWDLLVSGGRSVAPFRQTFYVRPPVRPNRLALAVIDRTRDVEVRWETDGYLPGDIATVSISGYPGLMCQAAAETGRVMLPASLLARIAANPAGILISIAPAATARKQFIVPLMEPGGLHRNLRVQRQRDDSRDLEIRPFSGTGVPEPTGRG